MELGVFIGMEEVMLKLEKRQNEYLQNQITVLKRQRSLINRIKKLFISIVKHIY